MGDDRGLAWSDEFLIGIEELDYEHRELIDDINRLHAELLSESDVEHVRGTLGRIHARMQAHFALEERVMTLNKYAGYAEHKAEHERLLDDYTEAMTGFGAGAGNREEIARVLRQWIVEHIRTADKKMSAMVTARGPIKR